MSRPTERDGRRVEAAAFRRRRLALLALAAAASGCLRGPGGAETPDVFALPESGAGVAALARVDRMIAFWTERARRDPHDPVSGERLADLWIERGRRTGAPEAYGRAEEALRRSLAVQPEPEAAALGRLARVLVARHRFDDASEAIERALAAAPETRSSAWLLAVRGDVAFARGDYEAAARDYRRFEARAPGPAAWTRLANVAQVRGALDRAERLLRAALEATDARAPEAAAWTRVQLAEVLGLSGRPADAERPLVEALGALPDYAPAWLHLADLFESRGDADRARRAIDRACELAVDPAARLRIARALERRGEAAGTEMRAAVREELERRLAAGDVSVRRELAEILLDAASRPEDLDGYARALDLARADLADRPGDPHALRVYARALRLGDRAAEALGPVRAMLRLNTPDPALHEEAAAVYGALGMDREARAQLSALRRLAPLRTLVR